MLDSAHATLRESGAMIRLQKGRYCVRQAHTDAEIHAAQALRAKCFRLITDRDCDRFDARCLHFLVHRVADGALVCCFRLMVLAPGDIARSYSAQFYGLSALEAYRGRMVELGRFCIDPAVKDPDVLRVAWGAMAAYVDLHDVALLFGCASFDGTATEHYLDTFEILKARHLAPRKWAPLVKAPDVFRYSAGLSRETDARAAMRNMPPLLRTYLAMGGWVSDHAVIDRQMNTLHVFTGVEIGAIPQVRKRLLRAVAG